MAKRKAFDQDYLVVGFLFLAVAVGAYYSFQDFLMTGIPLTVSVAMLAIGFNVVQH